MKLLDYIKENYKEEGEPILASELPCKSKGYLRQQLKELVDVGKLRRFLPGIYYLPFKNYANKDGFIKFFSIYQKKYLRNKDKVFGYYTRFSLYNAWQFTTQVPYVPQICTNNTCCNRMVTIANSNYFLYRPKTIISNKNVQELQFLDLMENLFKMTEVRGKEMEIRLRIFIDEVKPDFSIVKKLIDLYPSIVCKNMEKIGLLYLLK